MKKIIYCSALLASFYLQGFAQNENIDAKKLIRKANLQKTANWQDVFTNLFQLAVKDITGDNRSFDFKSSIFALRAKIDPSLRVDTNYVKTAFDRNFQVSTSLKLDSQYKFKAFSIGFTWAVVNKRDSTILSFIGTEEDLLFKNYFNSIITALNDYEQATIKAGTKAKFDSAQAAVKKMMSDGKVVLADLPQEFRKICSKTIEDNFNTVSKAISDELALIKKKALLTISANALFGKGKGPFNGGDAEIAYLKGLSKNKKPIELDFRLNFKATDTTINNKRYRTEIGFKGGLNWGIITSRGVYAPLIEIKPHIEYKRITRGLYPGEKESLFTANATATVRIAKGIWVPFTLKYDLKDKNFLGFLNVSLNWDAFKGSKN